MRCPGDDREGGIGRRETGCGRADGDRPALAEHRLPRVDEQVQQHLLDLHVVAVDAQARLDLHAQLASLRQRQEDIARYTAAYGHYCWEVRGLQDIRLAPFHLLATLATFYCFYVNAQLLVSAERGQPSAVRDVRKTFLLMSLFPIGLWYTQPRLQKLLRYN